MKSILALKKIYYNDHFSQADLEGLTIEEIDKVKKRCQTVAEVRAFIDTIIDEDYRSLSIFDFNGEAKDNKRILNGRESIRAKNQVCKYIWGYSWKDLKGKFTTEAEVKKYISCNSVLMRRLEKGNNVAIYGGSNGPCGRTMIASIIMKEAIKMRLFVPDIVSHTYDWVDFQTLTKDLRDDAPEIADYRTADWLVVENICIPKGETEGQIAYRMNLLDPFFMYRLKNNLPTILVFQYDLRSQLTPLYKTLGVGISNIVNNKRTCKIPLSERGSK